MGLVLYSFGGGISGVRVCSEWEVAGVVGCDEAGMEIGVYGVRVKAGLRVVATAFFLFSLFRFLFPLLAPLAG